MRRTRKQWVLLIGLSVLLLVVAGCGGNGNQQGATMDNQAQTAQTVEQLYANNCASCHGGNLEGGFGPAMEKVGSKLTKEQILQVLQKGTGSMPAQGHLSSQEQEKLAAWLAEKK